MLHLDPSSSCNSFVMEGYLDSDFNRFFDGNHLTSFRQGHITGMLNLHPGLSRGSFVIEKYSDSVFGRFFDGNHSF